MFLQLSTAHHDCLCFWIIFSRCRKGAGELLVSFDDLYPTDFWSSQKQEDDKSSSRNFQICGKEVPRGYWVGAQ
jgi:thiol oxidase